MTHRTALELGLLAGCLAGLWDYTTRDPGPVPRLATQPAEIAAPAVVPWPDPPPAARRFANDFRGMTLVRVTFNADLRGADFAGATLREVDFAAANLEGARFDGATYDRFCRWPLGFDPTLHGATLNHWPRP